MMGRRVTWRAGVAWLALACWPAAVLAAGCEEFGVKASSGPHYEFNFIDMGDQPKVKAQRGDLLGGAAFMPPSGAIPRGFDPYPFRGQPELAEQQLVNPLPAGDPKLIDRGKLMYKRYCVPCHDAKSGGEGKVPEKGFPKPPSLMTQRVRDWRDGRVYHVISEGQNIMPSYAAQVHPRDRWAIVRYLRQLQSTLPIAPPAAELAPAASAPPPAASAPAPADSAVAPPADSAAPPPSASSAAPASSASAPPVAPPPSASVPAAPEPAPTPPPSPGVPSRDDEVP